MDQGKTFRGKRIFGEHKTWLGLTSGTVAGGVTGGLIYAFYPDSVNQLYVVPFFPATSMIFFGALLGFGALIGDAIESFFKRRRNVAEGKSWFPYDQIDYIVGGLVASLGIKILSLKQYALIFVIWFLMHLLVSYIGYLLGLKEDPL